jgi:hypothetical protein
VKSDPVVNVFATKVEVRLVKDESAAFMWPSLESAPGAVQPVIAKASPAPADAITPEEPAPTVASASSAHAVGGVGATSGSLPPAYSTKKDWSKFDRDIKKEEEEEKPEGEEVRKRSLTFGYCTFQLNGRVGRFTAMQALHKLFRSIYGGADEVTF